MWTRYALRITVYWIHLCNIFRLVHRAGMFCQVFHIGYIIGLLCVGAIGCWFRSIGYIIRFIIMTGMLIARLDHIRCTHLAHYYARCDLVSRYRVQLSFASCVRSKCCLFCDNVRSLGIRCGRAERHVLCVQSAIYGSWCGGSGHFKLCAVDPIVNTLCNVSDRHPFRKSML